jgi:hypothetical protein
VIVILLCFALLVAGLVLIARWGSPAPVAPGAETLSWPRWAGVAVAAGAVAGVLVAGAGGRLIMRLLAVTSPESAGQVTEGQATIGEISVGGTLAVFIFGGMALGIASGLLYVLVGRLLPAGRVGGLLLGLLLLLLGATRVDPLRPDNFDFNLLGPAWLAVGSFVVLALVHGMLVVAVAGRLAAGARPPALADRALIGGRLAVVALALVTAPAFLRALADLV